MNHLTDEQLAAWLAGEYLAGDSSEDAQAHLASCTQCRSEAQQLRDGISRYSLAMRRESARAQSVHMAQVAPRKALALHRLRWAGTAAMALLLAAPTAWMIKSHSLSAPTQPSVRASLTSHPPTSYPAANSQPAGQMSDDELLEAVNNDLSREVPQALAPVSAITTARNQIAAASIGTAIAGNDSGKQGENK